MIKWYTDLLNRVDRWVERVSYDGRHHRRTRWSLA